MQLAPHPLLHNLINLARVSIPFIFFIIFFSFFALFTVSLLVWMIEPISTPSPFLPLSEADADADADTVAMPCFSSALPLPSPSSAAIPLCSSSRFTLTIDSSSPPSTVDSQGSGPLKLRWDLRLVSLPLELTEEYIAWETRDSLARAQPPPSRVREGRKGNSTAATFLQTSAFGIPMGRPRNTHRELWTQEGNWEMAWGRELSFPPPFFPLPSHSPILN